MIINPFEFWITQGDITFQLPVNPETVRIVNDSDDRYVDINELGQTMLKRPGALKEISFSSEFPKNYWQGCMFEDIQNPETYQQIIEYMKETGPIRFLITNTIYNELVTIDSFVIQEGGQELGAKNYSLRLREYRNKEVRKIRVENQQTFIDNVETRLDESTKPKLYTVKSGDSLWKIAKRVLKNGDKWKDIADLNGINKPYILSVGQVVKIP